MTAAGTSRIGPRIGALAAAALVLAAACGSAGSSAGGSAGLEVADAWAAEAADVGAVYLTIDNGGEADRLVGAATGAAGDVSLMGGSDPASHTAPDAPVDLDLPPGTTELAPGGRHLMLNDLREPLRPGDRVPLALRFERAGTREVDVEVLAWDETVDRMSEAGTP